jgi:hypothetical protein
MRGDQPTRTVTRCGLLALVSASVCLLMFAENVDAGPLKFTKFTIQATARTTERQVEVKGVHGFEFVNEPYVPVFTQGGGRPVALTSVVEFESEPLKPGVVVPTRDPKDVVVDIPPGLIGDPMAVPRCPLTQVGSETKQCPDATQIGYYVARLEGGKQLLAPVVNVTPEAGQSAEFALENTTKVDTPIVTGHLVRTLNPVTGKNEYTLTVVSKDIPMIGIQRVELTLWGVPADPSHDVLRGLFCTAPLPGEPLIPGFCTEQGGRPAGISPVPFLSLPTSCVSGAETATIRADSWEEPGSVGVNGQYSGYTEASVPMPAVTDCDVLQFGAGTGTVLEPDTEVADEPVGLGVKLNVPLLLQQEANATPNVRQTVVTLPEGMSVSPGVVDGIQACNATGSEGINIEGPESEFVGEDGEWHLAPGHCPDASIVGTAKAITPFLPEPVEGHVYLARPGCGGTGQAVCTERDALDGNLYRLYLELGGTGRLARSGIEFKVPLETEANPATGQLTSFARELPQLPYSEVSIKLNGGPRAPIDNPAVCGPAVTTADFHPWSAPGVTPEGLLVAGSPDLLSSSYYEVKGCPTPTPFKPGFVAGTVTPQAGQFTQFTLNISRQDREQYVKGIQVHTPPGLLGMLSKIPLCEEPAADAGTCPEASKIGTTRVASGAGSHPFELEGTIYLTGPHDGDPFGLSIVVPVVAGPFNLGKKVVRASIYLDPTTGALTVTTDETGPYAVPQIVFGVPVRLQRTTVDISRPEFMFNPTNCEAQQITANISGNQQAVASVSSPFAVGGCRSLAFKPKFTVSSNGRTSRTRGASLDSKLSYPAGSLGSEANIARVKVSLPRQLPSRLPTLQKACPAAVFARNPIDCPQQSIVGVVRATTPLLPVGLAGPVYFVSHGGEQFPSLVIVLQGYGVRVDLVGATFINKQNITSTTFNTVPDAPVGSFELYLPQGQFSALGANTNLCKVKGGLIMPTEFTAQNGALFKQSTKIDVTGCPKARKARTKSNGTGRKR